MDKVKETPLAYAGRLATYISDPSTVRVRTLERFGRSPPIPAIRDIIQHHRRQRERKLKRDSEPIGDNLGMPEPKVVPDPIKFHQPEPEPEPIPAHAHVLFSVPPWSVGMRDPKARIAEVARSFGLTASEVTGPSRLRYVVGVRSLIVALFVARGNSYPQIGKWLGGRDHSTIINSHRRFSFFCQNHPALADAYAWFRKEWGMDSQSEAEEPCANSQSPNASHAAAAPNATQANAPASRADVR